MTDRAKIEKRFEKSQDALVLQQSDLSLQSIADMVESKAIDISPKYQRRERWDPKRESELIESFLLNIPVPPIYLAEDEYGTYSVIDGKQRVTAISRFLQGSLSLSGLEKFKDLEGFAFSDLPAPLANALRIRPYLRVVTLLRQSDPDLKYEVFLRLNKAGVALNSQEIRNVAFRGKLNDMIIDASEEPYLVQQLRATPQSKIFREMIDVQYVLRYFTMLATWDKFPGNMDVAMDSYMAQNYKLRGKAVDDLRGKFIDALAFCEQVWGADGFMNPLGSKRIMQGFFDIQTVCPTMLTKQQRSKALRDPKKVRNALIATLKRDDEFKKSVTQFTSNPRSVNYRISRFLDALKAL